MSALIRKLAWSRLSEPKVAVAVSAFGLLLGMLVGATRAEHRDAAGQAAAVAPAAVAAATSTSSRCRDPVHRRHPRLPGARRDALGAQPGLAAQSAPPAPGQRGHRRGDGQPHPGRLIGHRELRRLRPDRGAGRQPVHDKPGRPGPRRITPPTTQAVGTMWKAQPSVYGPLATVIQSFAAIIGGPNVATTIWVLMILNGLVFIGVGVPAAEDLGRPDPGDAVLGGEPGHHPAAGQRRPPRHVRGGGGDLRHPGGAPGPRTCGATC